MEKQKARPFKLDRNKGFKRGLTLIEAALYVAGRPLNLKTLARVVRTRSKKKIRKLARALVKDYENRQTALEVLELEDERFVLQLKAEYTPRVKRLAVTPLLSKGPLKTLSYIAYRQPVLQPKVIDVRGHHVYSHLTELEDRGLITREKAGRTRLLHTTEYFADYFGLSHDLRTMKRQLQNIFEDFATSGPQKQTA